MSRREYTLKFDAFELYADCEMPSFKERIISMLSNQCTEEANQQQLFHMTLYDTKTSPQNFYTSHGKIGLQLNTGDYVSVKCSDTSNASNISIEIQSYAFEHCLEDAFASIRINPSDKTKWEAQISDTAKVYNANLILNVVIIKTIGELRKTTELPIKLLLFIL